MSTPIKQVLTAFLAQENINGRVFDYCGDIDDFRFVWGLSDTDSPTTELRIKHAEKIIKYKKILIIDDDSTVVIHRDKFGRHVRAIDWIHLFIRMLVAEGLLLPDFAFLDIRTMAAQRKYSAEGYPISFFYTSSIPEMLKWFKNENSIDEHLNLSAYLNRWSIGLALADNRDDHHSLNNSLGVLALAATMRLNIKERILALSDGAERRAAAALMQAFVWCECSDFSSDGTVFFLPNKKELRVLVLDDQVQEGWIPVLAELLGMDMLDVEIDGNCGYKKVACRMDEGLCILSLWVTHSPLEMLIHLTERVQNELGTPHANRMLTFTEMESPSFSEVLFLDLRLFNQTKENTKIQERDFFYKVNALIAMLDKNSASCNNFDGYLHQLPRFARAISLFDMKYPIILWSSTGQRKIIEQISDCHNVFCHLNKPRFDAYFSIESFIHTFWIDFLKAMQFAIQYATGRQWLSHICNFAMANEKFQQIWPSGEALRVEIYIDETGSEESRDENKPLWVGGIVVLIGGNNNNSTEEISRRFSEKLKETTIDLNENPKKKLYKNTKKNSDENTKKKLDWTIAPRDGGLDKGIRKTHGSKVWSAFFSVAKELNISIIRFALKAPKEGVLFSGDSWRKLDTRYYITMPEVIKSMISISTNSILVRDGSLGLIIAERVFKTNVAMQNLRPFVEQFGKLTPRQKKDYTTKTTDNILILFKVKPYFTHRNPLILKGLFYGKRIFHSKILVKKVDDQEKTFQYISVSNDLAHATLTQACLALGVDKKWTVNAARAVNLHKNRDLTEFYRMAQFIPDVVLWNNVDKKKEFEPHANTQHFLPIQLDIFDDVYRQANEAARLAMCGAKVDALLAATNVVLGMLTDESRANESGLSKMLLRVMLNIVGPNLNSLNYFKFCMMCEKIPDDHGKFT